MKKKFLLTFIWIFMLVSLIACQSRQERGQVASLENDHSESLQESKSNQLKFTKESLPEERSDQVKKNFRQNILICLDPGHSAHASSEMEAIGPGASEKKRMATLGAAGVWSGQGEYELNLTIGLKLKEELLDRGYQVLMTRETNEVLIGNVERAQIANEAGCNAFIRIHADGSDDPAASGAMVVTISKDNPYNSEYYDISRQLGKDLIEAYTEATGFKARRAWETDSMTGLNWAECPSVLFEMGFMSNPEEEKAMQDPSMQEKMVQGLANGLDRFFKDPINENDLKENDDE